LVVDAPSRARGLPAWGVFILKIGLTVIVTGFVVQAVGFGLDDLSALEPGWWRPRWGLALLASLILVAGYALSAMLWGWMASDLGGGSLPPGRAVRVFMTANLARYVPGKVWQIAGLALLARREGVPPMVASTAAVLGQAAALGGATVVGAATFFAADEGVRGWGWAALSLVAAGAVLSLMPSASDRLMRAWFRITRSEASDDLQVSRTFGVRWLVLYIANWIIYAAAFVVLVYSYGIEGSAIQIGAAFAAAYVIGYVAVFAPAGLGVRESFLVVFLSPVTGPIPAGGLAIVSRFWTTAVEALAAVAANVDRSSGESREEGGAL